MDSRSAWLRQAPLSAREAVRGPECASSGAFGAGGLVRATAGADRREASWGRENGRLSDGVGDVLEGGFVRDSRPVLLPCSSRSPSSWLTHGPPEESGDRRPGPGSPSAGNCGLAMAQ